MAELATQTTGMPATGLITGDQLLLMGDIGPCELIDGKVVPMNPTNPEHGFVESNLCSEIRSFVRSRNLGWVITGEIGIYIRRNPDRVRGADIVFLSKKTFPSLPTQGFLEVAPDLVVEVVSPGDPWREIEDKIDDYFEIKVRRVWIVEPKKRSVTVYQSRNQTVRLGPDDLLSDEEILPGFGLRVGDIFE